jgi:hypothetical protein
METNRLRGFAISVLAALCIALVSARARADDVRRPPAVLSKTYNVTLGQMIAVSSTTILQTLKPIDAPMMAMFDGKKIEIWVLGARSTADGAQETLEKFQEKAWPPLVAMIQGLYGVKLSDQQVTVIYRNRDADNREVMRRENGQYFVK